MKLVVLSYYDKKLGVYNSPIFVREASDEDIIEDTRRMCANPDMGKMFFEFDLYRLGSFDDKVGEFELEEKPVFVVSLSDFRYLAEEKDHGESK